MKTPIVRLIALLFVSLLCFQTSWIRAQGREGGVSLNQPTYATPANYSIAKPGELTMPVNIWGLVNHPGRYEVSIATDLIQLVSYAGGPAADADLSGVKVTRFLKTESGVTKSEIIVDLDRLYRVNDASLILQPGDTIVFDRSSWANIRDVISVVTSVAIVTATVTTVIVTTRGK
jgi:hypothetical protein